MSCMANVFVSSGIRFASFAGRIPHVSVRSALPNTAIETAVKIHASTTQLIPCEAEFCNTAIAPMFEPNMLASIRDARVILYGKS